MADNSVEFVSLQCEQRIVIKFLVKEGTPVVEIVKRLKAVFAEETLSTSTIYEWAKQFKEGRTSVDDDNRAGAPRTAVTRDNIAAVDLAIKQNRRISVLELSSNIGVSVGSIDTIIHEHLLFSKVTARWVPKMLTENAVQGHYVAARQRTGSHCKCDVINNYQTGLGSVGTSPIQSRFGTKRLSLVWTSQESLGWNEI